MAVDASNPLSGLDPSLFGSTQKDEAKKVVGKDDFLALLVTQLKNQDPLEPSDQKEFVAQLAQFSQLEQLIDINNKVGSESTSFGDNATLAGYLGNEVLINSETVTMEGGEGGILRVKLPSDAANAKLQLFGSDGSVAGEYDLGALPAGKHTIELSGLSVPNGEYSFGVQVVGTNGSSYEAQAQVGGLVTGFIPGPEPKLVVGNKEIAPADIVEVALVPKSNS